MGIKLKIGRKKKQIDSNDTNNNNKSLLFKILEHWKPILIIVFAYMLFFEPSALQKLIGYVVTTIREALLNV